MSNDIHPHWKSTSVDGTISDDRTERLLKRIQAPKQHVKVKRKSGGAHYFFILFMAAGTIGVLVFVFIQGVSFLQADLMQEFKEQDLSEESIPFSVSVGSDGEQADEVIALDTINEAEEVILKEEKEPKVIDSPAKPKAQPAPMQKTVSLPKPVPPIPTLTIETTPSVPAKAPAVAAIPPHSAPPVFNVGNISPSPNVSRWPSQLRVNRYTVGSDFVPAVSPMQEVTVEPFLPMQKKAHASAPMKTYPRATAQPKTGPELWVVALISLSVLTLVRNRILQKAL